MRLGLWIRVCVVSLAMGGCALQPAETGGPPGIVSGVHPPVITSEEWGSVPPARAMSEGRSQTAIHTLTVHHQGLVWMPGSDVAAYLRNLQQWSRRAKGWIDVPYHYIIAPDGAVYQGRSPKWAGDTNTDYDTQGHLQVMLLGNFEEQRPTERQWRSTVDLLTRLMIDHDLTPQNIAAHRHHTGQTVCPGAHLMTRFEDLREAVAQQAAHGKMGR